MASQDEVIRYVYEVSGSKELQAVAKQLIETGGASEDVEAQIRGLADEFGKLGKEAAQASDLQKAGETFRDLAKAVLATEKSITSAKGKVAELGKAISATEEPTKKQTREFEASRKELERLERTQAKQRGTLNDLKAGFTAAGLSTRNLGAAEKELTTRIQASQAAMAGLVTSARATVTARADAARAEKTLIDQLRTTVAQQQRAAQATANLQRARETLAQRSQSASASERNYSQTLGTSAAKIAAIGAAALGITSAVGLARNGLSQLVETAGEFQKLDVQLDSVFGEGSTDALTAIQKFAQETPYQLQQVSESFVKLKAFGLDPLDGTFQAIADQAAKLGGSQETLTGITLALGQAQAKQKLQGEEILQLVERGVPVWDLLTKATGKNVQELQKLSEAGKLGRTEIKLLIDEIGRSAEGASGALANTLPGQINRLKGEWVEFLNLIANSGVLDYLQEQLAAVSEEVDRMAATGELKEWAQDIAGAIVGAAKAIQGVTGFLIEHRKAIVALASAYAGFKTVTLIGNLATAFAALATRVVASTAALVAGTSATLGMLGPLGLLAGALAFTANATLNLVDGMQKVKDVNAEVAAAELDLITSSENLAAASKAKQTEYAEFADVVIAKSSELADKSEADTQSYIQQLKGAIEYTRALGNEAIATGDNVGRLAARAKLDDLEASLAAAKKQMVDLRDVSALAFETVGKVGTEAAAKFDDLIASGKSAKEAVDGIFKDLDLTKAEGLANAAAQIKAIAARGTEAAAVVRDELRAQILKLSDEDFATFKTAAADAFRSTFQGSEDLKASLAGINLERLGVDIEQIKTGFSSVGRSAIAAFQGAVAEIDGLGLTVEQRAQAIGQSFDAAFAKAKTKADIQALGDELSKAFDKGDLGITDYMSRLDQLKAKIDTVGKAPGGSQPADAGKQAFQQATTAAADLGAEVEATGEKAVAAGEAATSASRDIANIYAGWINQFLQTSRSAADEFQRLTAEIFNLGAGVATGAGLSRFGEAINQASTLITEGIERQKIGVAGLADAYAGMSDKALQELVRTRGGVDDVSAGMALLAQNAREGISEFSLLGVADLSGLAASAQQVADRVRQIGEEATNTKRALADMASSYLDQIDQLEGNQDSQELRRHERELQRIKDQAEAAGVANSSEYNDALAAETRLHNIKMANIRKEKEERKKAEAASASSSGSSASTSTNTGSTSTTSNSGGMGGQPVVINVAGGGQPINLFGQSPADVQRLIEFFRQAANNSGQGGSLSG